MYGDKKKNFKYNLNPRGNTWANDESKKCQKMMEKFGWERGKGLGRNEDGIKENIKANGNMGKKGFGCTSQARDNWLFQQDEYSSLLENLNQIHGKKEEDQKESSKVFVDLEENCKHSTSRVYYSKFVRGKNLATKSQKDLDCILGPSRNKKTIEKEEPEKVKPLENEEEQAEEQPKETQKSIDLLKPQAVNMYAYFAEKMAALKKAAAVKQSNEEDHNTQSTDAVSLRNCSEVKGSKKRRHSCSDDDKNDDCHAQKSVDVSVFPQLKSMAGEVEIDEEEVYRPKKKRKKMNEEQDAIKDETMEEEEIPTKAKKSKSIKEKVESTQECMQDEEAVGAKKSKKSKDSQECKGLIREEVSVEELIVPERSKKSKKKKDSVEMQSENREENETVGDGNAGEVPKARKKSKKSKHSGEIQDEEITAEPVNKENSSKKKKGKKSKHD